MDPLRKLPLFSKVRSRLKPRADRAFLMTETFLKDIGKLDFTGQPSAVNDPTTHFLHIALDSFVVEMKGHVLFHFWVGEDNTLNCDLYDKRGRFKERHYPQELILRVEQRKPGAFPISEFEGALALLTTNFLLWLNQPSDGALRTLDGEKVEAEVIVARVGDSFKYHSIERKEIKTGLKRGPLEGPRMAVRDHAVKGHWRNLKDGRQIRVRPHRRGNIEVGTVTSIYGE